MAVEPAAERHTVAARCAIRIRSGIAARVAAPAAWAQTIATVAA